MMIRRFYLERLTDRNRTEYYDGCEAPKYDGWSTDPQDALEFETVQKAQRRADRVGGEVCPFDRFATPLEAAIADMRAFPTIHLKAAE